jgi:putative heme-binding domain-containing protein
MDQKYRLKCMVILGPIACLTTVLAGNAQNLPNGPGKADFQRICSVCHSVEMATGQRMSREDWSAVVNDMVGKGAQGSSAELDNVVTYLSTNFGKGNSPAPSAASAAPATAPAHAAAPPAATVNATPLSGAEISKANALIQANGCLSCHRIGDTGSYVGPYLGDVGAHRSAEQLQAALVSPNKEVLPENRTVRLVTSDGKTVTGRLLNQDGFSVQIIDSSNQLRSIEKSGLREFTIVTTNPMPSFQGKLSEQDLTDLVHYLSSLRGDAAQ